MGLQPFLSDLLEEGRVRVGRPDAGPPPGRAPDPRSQAGAWERNPDSERDPAREQQPGVGEFLVEFERQYRLELPGEPPQLALPAAVWAAERFYRACQFLMFRDAGPEAVAEDLNTPGPPAADAATQYAVDLTFRFLPDLVRQARAAAEGDVLVRILLEWANRWPLSSVGIAGGGAPADGESGGPPPAAIDALCAHNCLRRMYTDRIIARGDVSRLGDERVRTAVAEALGAYPELARDIASALQRRAAEEPPR